MSIACLIVARSVIRADTSNMSIASLSALLVAASLITPVASPRVAPIEAPPDIAAERALQELATHGVEWNSPGLTAAGSMPIGNGSFGANVWMESTGDLVLTLAHTDAFSEAERLLKLLRVHIVCDPPLDVSKFSQRMSFADGEITINCGANDNAARVRIFVDSESPVLHVTIEGERERTITARVENWRNAARRIVGDELKSAWVMRDAPASIEVIESADVIIPMESEPDAVAWYHRNEHSIVPLTLEHQGLAAVATVFEDPLIMRTFGARIDGVGFTRTDELTMRSAAPTRDAALRITASCAQADGLDSWIKRLAMTAEMNSDVEAARTRTAQWWQDRFTRSWVFVDAPTPSVIDNTHPLRIGFDSNNQNRFDGAITIMRFGSGAASDSEIAQVAHADIDIRTAREVVARNNGSTEKLADEVTRDGSFTVEGWITPSNESSTGRIADKLTAGRSDGFLFDLQQGSLRAIVGDITLATTAKPKAGVLTHVALTYDQASNRVTVYHDGVMVGQSPASAANARTSISQAYAAQRAVTLAATDGAFPVKFNGSIFSVEPAWVNGAAFNADFRNWGGDYWWQNTRLPYHGMLARGDGDHLASLFDFYFKALPGCKARAKEYHHVDGAYFPETMTTFATYGNGDYGWNREGRKASDVDCPYWQYTWNQGLELLAMMLDHYDYTHDESTLRARTIPMAREVLAYFASRFSTDANGMLVITPTQVIETYWSGVVNDLPNIVGLREVLTRLLALDKTRASTDLIRASDRVAWTSLRSACPPVPLTADGTKYAPAAKFDDVRSNCENAELYAVWPFTESSIGRDTLAIGRASFAARVERMTHGWTQDGMQAARLGLADEAAANVLAKVGNTHRNFRYPTFWGPNFDWLPDQCHGGNLLTTVQEMLLQNVGDRIAVLPAWPTTWNARFRLRAADNTVITGVVRDGALVTLDVDPPSRRDAIFFGEGWKAPQ